MNHQKERGADSRGLAKQGGEGLKPEESSGYRYGCGGHYGVGKHDGCTRRGHSEVLY